MSVIFWLIYYPIMNVLRTLLMVVAPVRKRYFFEQLNVREQGAQSFKVTWEKADIAFEFSSEGEYQQVAGLIDDALKEQKKIELIFFSPSVEKTVIELWKKYPTQIRYQRFALLAVSPLNHFNGWITAKTLVMVRYDLFPDFLIWALKSGNTLKFVWVTFKKERAKNAGPSFFKKLFLKKSMFTVYATEEDKLLGESLGFTGEAYDFRMEQIKRRVERREEKFANLFPDYTELKSQLARFPREKRIMMGNAWPVDMDLLKNIASDDLVVIVPHKLDQPILNAMTVKLKEMGRTPLEVKDNWPGEANTYIINKKGILCELYADFGKAYVGGGLGVSVHSLLEPLIAGSELISCGPVHHRSTEFDLTRTYGNLHVVKNPDEFRDWSALHLPSEDVRGKMENVFSRYSKLMREVLLC